jgi:CCR4-NOT transcription complex subunit 1
VTVTLLRSGLLDIALQDQQLAKVLFTDPRPSLLNFAAGLIRECLSSDPPVASRSQFSYTLDILAQISQTGKGNEQFVKPVGFCFCSLLTPSCFCRVSQLLDDLLGVTYSSAQMASDALIPQPITAVKLESEQLRDKLFVWFQHWVHIFQRSAAPEKSFVPFINQLTKQGILKVEDVSSFFFRVCAESSINSYIKCMTTGDYDYAFQALDAMSRLIVCLIKYHGDALGVNNDQAKVHYMTKILSIFVLVLANMHEEQGPQFQQKPFFRFFSSLINDLHAIESQLGPVYFQLLCAIR